MSNFNLDSLLDETLDDLADLPEFKPYPAGVHRVLCTLTRKKVGDKEGIEASFKYRENVEMNDPTQPAPAAGATASTFYDLANEFAQGNFKNLAKGLSGYHGSGNLRKIVEETKDVECVIVTSIRNGKDKGDGSEPAQYLNVKELLVE